MALLTPGPYSETYFEHAYLARYLGLPLAEGGDLTVRGEHLFLKTVEGLERVHGLLRRVDDDWCDALAAEDIYGIAVDTYAVWWDPNLETELKRAGKRICAFHVNDWLPDTRDLRLDRGMMGDGLIDIRGIRAMVEAAGYTGTREVEIFSERDWWQRDPNEVLRIVKQRYQSAV